MFSNISDTLLEKLEYQETLYNKQISDWDDTVQSVIALIKKVSSKDPIENQSKQQCHLTMNE